MSTRALGRRLADVARRQAEAAERHAAATATVDVEHAKRVAFLMMVPEDLRMAVEIALCDPNGDDALSTRGRSGRSPRGPPCRPGSSSRGRSWSGC
ncbi:MAG TPA: hypothetical protein VD866_05490 [Urbifossiella sp.]|nr:hypothetical protein [Urbifossiella sp.]